MEEKKIILPMEVAPAKIKNPRNLIIFSKYKVGKTSALAQLPDSLIIDLENGSDYVSGRILKANSVEDIRAIGKAIEEAGKPYKYLIIDTNCKHEEYTIGDICDLEDFYVEKMEYDLDESPLYKTSNTLASDNSSSNSDSFIS